MSALSPGALLKSLIGKSDKASSQAYVNVG
jgi:hypothetical protein